MSSSPSPLRTFLESRGGEAPWRDWMDTALYDPANGYYSTHIRTVGRRGDFSTSATLGDALGRAIAAWIRCEWKRARNKLSLIEVGPGDGSLHLTVLSSLGLTGRLGLRSHLVERSPVLRKLQRATLRKFRRHLMWHDTMESALKSSHGHALIFSNEVADAFPAALLQLHEGQWKEVWLAIAQSGGIVESLRSRPAHITSSAFDLTWPEGQRIEVLQSWRDWLVSWRERWKTGAMLTIDYGGTPAEIYFRRPDGTARGYFHHQRMAPAGLYLLTGRCDVTVDVNFTDLRQWGEAAGLTTVEYIAQQEFVRSLTKSGVDSVHDRNGAAEAFRCLVQRPA